MEQAITRGELCLDVLLRASHVWLANEKVSVNYVANLRRKIEEANSHHVIFAAIKLRTTEFWTFGEVMRLSLKICVKTIEGTHVIPLLALSNLTRPSATIRCYKTNRVTTTLGSERRHASFGL